MAVRTFLQVNVWVKGTSPFGDKLRFTISQEANTVVTVCSAFQFGLRLCSHGGTGRNLFKGLSGNVCVAVCVMGSAQGRVYVFPIESDTRLAFFPSMSLILTFHGKEAVIVPKGDQMTLDQTNLLGDHWQYCDPLRLSSIPASATCTKHFPPGSHTKGP